MARPQTVSRLLEIVEQQAATIRALTVALGQQGGRKMQVEHVTSVIPTLPQDVEAAIVAKAGMTGELRDYLEQYAWEAIASGMPESLVAEQIAAGVQD